MWIACTTKLLVSNACTCTLNVSHRSPGYAPCFPTSCFCLADLMAAETQIYSDISIDKRFLEAFMPFAPIIGIADDSKQADVVSPATFLNHVSCTAL